MTRTHIAMLSLLFVVAIVSAYTIGEQNTKSQSARHAELLRQCAECNKLHQEELDKMYMAGRDNAIRVHCPIKTPLLGE